LTNTDLREKLRQKGLKKSLEYDWKKCASETLSVLTKGNNL
jgi:hypothetical protein